MLASPKGSIADYKKERNYMLCPHTAAGIHVMRYAARSKRRALARPAPLPISCFSDVTFCSYSLSRGLCTAVTPKLPWICFATAHPGKFGDALDECRSYLPGVPPQLEGKGRVRPPCRAAVCAFFFGSPFLPFHVAGLLQREKRCEHIKHDINELRSLMNAHQAERSQSSTSLCHGTAVTSTQSVPLFSAAPFSQQVAPAAWARSRSCTALFHTLRPLVLASLWPTS